MDDPGPEDVRRARERVARAVHRTPLIGSRYLSERVGRPVYLKGEHLQKTGAFKVRGALNFMLDLDDAAKERGVITISAGNHAQATFVHPFDDPRVVAGQGTLALEILEDLPDLATVVVPIGGGGLCAGVAVALKEAAPDVDIYGVEPEGAAAMHRSLREGSPVRLDAVDTIADGLGAPMAGDLTFAILRNRIEDVVTVSDSAIARALGILLERAKQLVEPGGAAGVAALLEGLIPPGSGPVVAVLSGGNVELASLDPILRLGAP
jgi:threonine dehydratase